MTLTKTILKESLSPRRTHHIIVLLAVNALGMLQLSMLLLGMLLLGMLLLGMLLLLLLLSTKLLLLLGCQKMLATTHDGWWRRRRSDDHSPSFAIDAILKCHIILNLLQPVYVFISAGSHRKQLVHEEVMLRETVVVLFVALYHFFRILNDFVLGRNVLYCVFWYSDLLRR